MGIPVMIMGESGAGKSTSLRNFELNEIAIFAVASKPLPFRKRLAVQYHADYNSILKGLAKSTRKAYAIDDSQYLMAFEEFRRAKETGYGKFTDMAVHFYNLLEFVRDKTPDDCIVYFLHHIMADDFGHKRVKTVGKMLDSKLTIEGLFSIVLLAETDGKQYWFTTQSDGTTTAKSPMEMFPPKIDNDLKAVDTAIREYYFLNEEEK